MAPRPGDYDKKSGADYLVKPPPIVAPGASSRDLAAISPRSLAPPASRPLPRPDVTRLRAGAPYFYGAHRPDELSGFAD